MRLIYLLEQSHTPFFDIPYLDEQYHVEWAKYFSLGNESSFVDSGVYYKGPMYPWFLGVQYFLFGDRPPIFKLIQMILGAFSCVLLYWIGERIFNPRVGLLAGLVMAFYPVLIYYNGELLIESFFVFVTLSAFFLLFKTVREQKGIGRHFIVGVAFGLAAITRPNILLFMPVLFFLYLFDLRNYWEFKKRILCGLVLALGTLMPILPVTAINAIRGHDFVLISYEGGINFYMGNKPSADGHSAKTDKRYDYTGHYRDSVEYYSQRKMQDETARKEIKPSEISSYWYRKSWDWIKSNPMDWIYLLLKKTVLFFDGYEIQDNKNIYFMAEQSWVLRIGLLFLNFYILLPLGLIGFVALSKSREGRVILAYTICYSLSVIFFFVGSRYRVPILPFFILSAVGGIYYTFQSRYKWIFAFSFVLLFMFGFMDWYHVKQDFNPAEDDWGYGSTYLSRVTQQVEATGKYDHQDLDKAQFHFCKALEKYPPGSQDFYILQQIYLDYGKSFYVDSRYDKAREEWEKMLSAYEMLKSKPIKVDYSLLKAAHKNLAVYYQDKAGRASNEKEKEEELRDAQSHLGAMEQIPD